MPQIRLEPTSRHPIVIFMLGLLIFSGFSVAFGAPAPGSVNEALPRWGVQLWGGSLFFGGVSVLIGLKMQEYLGKRSVSGALLEQVGMSTLAAAGTLYSVAAVAVAGWPALIPAGLVLGLAAACGYRWWQIRGQIKAYVERKARETAGNGEH
jgi:hypothetical protein